MFVEAPHGDNPRVKTSNALTIHESNTERLIVFKAPYSQCTSRARQSCARRGGGGSRGSNTSNALTSHKSNTEQLIVFKAPLVSPRVERDRVMRDGGGIRNTFLFLGLYLRPPIRTTKQSRFTQKCGLGPH